jgi:hypothetical protein
MIIIAAPYWPARRDWQPDLGPIIRGFKIKPTAISAAISEFSF